MQGCKARLMHAVPPLVLLLLQRGRGIPLDPSQRQLHPAGQCKLCPHHSDVIATSRAVHYTPDHGYDTWSAMQAFHATRLDWVYNRNASFVSEAHERGFEVSLAMNPQCPDAEGKYDQYRVQNIHGRPLVAPWMRAWKGEPRNYGCVNNPGYLQIALDFGSNLLKIGSDAIQHDDPGANGEASTWNNGDPEQSGCYCDHCMSGFTARLLDLLSPVEQNKLNVTADFNYRELLLHNPWNGSNSSTVRALRPLFVDYQRNVSELYLSNLRQHLDETAHSLGRTTSLSCNGGGGWSTHMACDYVLGELNAADATPQGLENIFWTELPDGKAQVMTMPKHHNKTLVESPAFEVLIRTSIAYTYALGSNMMAPWDIYLPTPQAERYYGNASQYGDLYAFVRRHAALLDATTLPVPTPQQAKPNGGRGGEANYNHTYNTGRLATGQMGNRWRFPFPFTSPGYSGPRINGSKYEGQSLLSCQSLCDDDDMCKGVYLSSTSSECFTLNELVRCETTLRGDSYTRTAKGHAHPAQPSSPVSTAEPDVRLRLRVAPNHSVAALHVIDWRNSMPSVWTTGVLPNRTFGLISVNVSNSVLQPKSLAATRGAGSDVGAVCGNLRFSLHGLADTAPVVLTGQCSGGMTVLKLPSPGPWSIIEVKPMGHRA
jgi:hypothetical protein